jgi:hypothetical protein
MEETTAAPPRTRTRRRRRALAIGGFLGVALIAFVLLYFEPQAAFFDDHVAETLPGLEVPVAEAAGSTSLAAARTQAQATGAPIVVSTANFISGEHDTTGAALVVALPDGSLAVRFEDLDTSNGPDLHVVLSTDEASDAWKYDGRRHLGALKGNIGDQNYDVPADIDLAQFRSVVIWCERFDVAFGAASIQVSA